MNKTKIFYILLGLLFLFLTGNLYYTYSLHQKVPKTAYINLQEVFSNFQMTKEYGAKLQSANQSKKLLLDSLEFRITTLKNELVPTKSSISSEKQQELNALQEQYDAFQQKFSNEGNDQLNSLNTQIYKQLNQYVKDYGEVHHYAYIYGLEGSGVIMYARNDKDITKDVIEFINNEYAGKIKK